MRPVRSVCLYFLLIFLGSACLAPWLYKLIQTVAGNIPISKGLAEIPFSRYLNRTMMLFGIIGLWPLTRNLGLRSWQDLGLRRSANWWKESGAGFLVGFGSLASVALVTLFSGVRVLDKGHTTSEVLRHLANAGSAAIVVSLLEELSFRGVLFGGLRKALAWPVALLASSAIYAGLHFVQRAKSPDSIDWSSGFIVLGFMLRSLGSVEQLFPAFFTLALAGVILGSGYQWTGALYFSAGLHAGWIFWLKSYGFLTREVVLEPHWFWGSGKLIDGCLALIALAIVLALLFKNRPPADFTVGVEKS